MVADGCSDATAELARGAGAEVVVTEHRKKSKALNSGLERITADIVVGIDADSILAPDAVERMVADLGEDDYDATSATVMPQQRHGLFVRSRRFSYAVTCLWWRLVQKQVGRLQCMSGCGWAIRRQVLTDMGGVPTDLVSEARNTTWALYAHGARVTYSSRALVYTLEPETLGVYVKQMRRWASTFFQVVSRHKRELRKPSALFVVATTTWDIVTVPVLYVLAYGHLIRAGRWPTLGIWFAVSSLFTMAVASRTIGWREAVLCFVPNKVVMFLDKGIYFQTFVREWVLGRHYCSWTGRQGVPTVISPMSAARRRLLIGIGSVAGVWAAVLVAGSTKPQAPPMALGRTSPTPVDPVVATTTTLPVVPPGLSMTGPPPRSSGRQASGPRGHPDQTGLTAPVEPVTTRLQPDETKPSEKVEKRSGRHHRKKRGTDVDRRKS